MLSIRTESLSRAIRTFPECEAVATRVCDSVENVTIFTRIVTNCTEVGLPTQWRDAGRNPRRGNAKQEVPKAVDPGFRSHAVKVLFQSRVRCVGSHIPNLYSQTMSRFDEHAID